MKRANSPLSEFIRNATPEEKSRVYGAVMDMAVLSQRGQAHGCRKPNICNMDHPKGSTPGELEKYVNRICVTCYRHWYGPVGAVKEYSRADWDALMATAFDDDLETARTVK